MSPRLHCNMFQHSVSPHEVVSHTCPWDDPESALPGDGCDILPNKEMCGNIYVAIDMCTVMSFMEATLISHKQL